MISNCESYLELLFDVEYEVTGKYIPATRDDPAEYPEITIISVMLGNTDVTVELESKVMDVLQVDCEADAIDKGLVE